MAWQRRKFDAGYGAITWPVELGGAGLGVEHLDAFLDEEAAYEVPASHETFSVTVRLVAPTIARFGTEQQQDRFIRPFLRTEVLCCQLFSEPGAGSDLAGLGTSAVRDGDEWVVNGQKVWSSGARFAACGRADLPHGPVGPQARGAHRLPRADGRTRRGGAPDQADERRRVLQRGLPHRRPDPRHAPARRRRRRLERRAHDARLRAGQQRQRARLGARRFVGPGAWTRLHGPASRASP